MSRTELAYAGQKSGTELAYAGQKSGTEVKRVVKTEPGFDFKRRRLPAYCDRVHSKTLDPRP
eukprot:1928988-Rhodomonas_salina.2